MAARALVLASACTAAVFATPWNGNATAPRQVHLALTEDPSGVLFSWTTGTPIWAPPAPAGGPNATSPAVRVGLAPGALTSTAASNFSLMYRGVGDVTHRVNVSGLAPSTRYYYSVGDAVLDAWSPVYSFFSRARADADATIDFIAYADMGFWNGSATVVQAAVTAELARGDRNYAFVTHIGDISYSGLEAQSDETKDTQLWDLFMDEIAPISSAAPYMVAPGNHDVLALVYTRTTLRPPAAPANYNRCSPNNQP